MPIRLALSVLVFLPAALACDAERRAGAGGSACGAEATLLASKLDDDDGDGAPYDEDYPLVDDEDDDIADHAWVRDRFGTYHLFFHTENLYHPSRIEHYTTRDFRTLRYVGVALAAAPGAWDADALWAPHIVENDGVYYMFYTGVAGSGPDAVQRVGVAASTDLTTWTRAPINRCPGTSGDGCVYECDELWTTWGDAGGAFDHQCRDPFVLWDESARRWLMFATARSTNGFGVVTVASAEDLAEWSGEGFVDATRRLAAGTGAQTTGGEAENPFVVTHARTHYLLFTDWRDPEDSVSVAPHRAMAQYAVSPSLSADDGGSVEWRYVGYLPDPGVNAIEVIEVRRPETRWLMSQSIARATAGMDAGDRRKLRLKCVLFGPGESIETSNWGASRPSAAQPLSVDLFSSRE